MWGEQAQHSLSLPGLGWRTGKEKGAVTMRKGLRRVTAGLSVSTLGHSRHGREDPQKDCAHSRLCQRHRAGGCHSSNPSKRIQQSRKAGGPGAGWWWQGWGLGSPTPSCSSCFLTADFRPWDPREPHLLCLGAQSPTPWRGVGGSGVCPGPPGFLPTGIVHGPVQLAG